jgi:presequence protease
LWDKVRVQGGAYGAFCPFDRLSGVLTFISYRDPNIQGTLEVYDQSGEFLRQLDINRAELTKSIIGVIGEMDAYQLPDAQGYTSMTRYLTGVSDEDRQCIREEVLATTQKDFRAFGDVLDRVKNKGLVVVLGSVEAIEDLNKEGKWMEILKVL